MSLSFAVDSPFSRALIAGAVAGTSVDLSLYPIDTLKTRLQSSKGFYASGGFRGIYAGIGSAAFGAAPGAALFFVAYEGVKDALMGMEVGSDGVRVADSGRFSDQINYMVASSVGEIAACAVRVPTEVVKQRAQALEYKSSGSALGAILQQRKNIGIPGVWRELYRGWNTTVMRELPFTMIQFPMWEAMKNLRKDSTKKQEVSAIDSAVFGSLSGAVAAALTNPLDVLKTRVMLSREKVGVVEMAGKILETSGHGAFYAGIVPRTIWISIGGFVFLGSYQLVYNALERRRRQGSSHNL